MSWFRFMWLFEHILIIILLYTRLLFNPWASSWFSWLYGLWFLLRLLSCWMSCRLLDGMRQLNLQWSIHLLELVRLLRMQQQRDRPIMPVEYWTIKFCFATVSMHICVIKSTQLMQESLLNWTVNVPRLPISFWIECVFVATLNFRLMNFDSFRCFLYSFIFLGKPHGLRLPSRRKENLIFFQKTGLKMKNAPWN